MGYRQSLHRVAGTAKNGHQQVIEIVRQPARQPAQAFELLFFEDGVLRLFLTLRFPCRCQTNGQAVNRIILDNQQLQRLDSIHCDSLAGQVSRQTSMILSRTDP
jgi:hypothetical protein